MNEIMISRGYTTTEKEKKTWVEHKDGDFFLIMTEEERYIIPVSNTEKLTNVLTFLAVKKEETFEDLIIKAQQKDIGYFYEFLEEKKEKQLDAVKNEEDYEETRSMIDFDYKGYKTFFEILVLEKNKEKAVDVLREMDTAPRETLIEWVRQVG